MSGPRAEVIGRYLAALGIAAPPAALEQLAAFEVDVAAENERQNLVGPGTAGDIALFHLADAAAALPWLPAGAPRAVDVGAGAGFPGIPLAILRPDLVLTLVEAEARKARFLEEACAKRGLVARVIHGRAEDLGRDPEHRERYDVALARAVAPMAALLELCLPLVAVGGRVVVHKGSSAGAELAVASNALRLLGGSAPELHPYQLPGVAGLRHVVVVHKEASTPAPYPRRAGMPARRPLS